MVITDGCSLDLLGLEARVTKSLMGSMGSMSSSLHGNTLRPPLERGFTLSDATLWK